MNKDEVTKYVKDKINNNLLNLDIEEVVKILYVLEKEYNIHCYKILFMKYIHNLIVSIINDKNITNIFSHIEITKHRIMDIVYYQYLDNGEYEAWKTLRPEIYDKLNFNDIRLLNYFEMSTLNFITDISDKTFIIYNNDKVYTVEQKGYNIYYNRDKQTPFMSFLSKYFRLNYAFKYKH